MCVNFVCNYKESLYIQITNYKNFLSYIQAHMAHCSVLTHGHLVSLLAMKDAYLQFSFTAVVPLHITLIFFYQFHILNATIFT